MNHSVSLLTTFNQFCGLATYAGYLVNAVGEDKYVILAEDVDLEARIGNDQPNVIRCWKRLVKDYAALDLALHGLNTKLLHINCQHSFFDSISLPLLLEKHKKSGLKIITQFHSPESVYDSLRALGRVSDAVVVHTEENKLEIIANNIPASKIFVIEHGVEKASSLNREAARKNLGISANKQMLVCFGFIREHKGIHEVIASVDVLRSVLPHLELYIVGQAHESDTSSKAYAIYLRQLANERNVADRVHFVSDFVPMEIVQNYLVAADVVVMNYSSNCYEASGAVSLALGCGAAIVTSNAPAFARLGSTVFHTSSGFSLPVSMQLVIENKELSEALRASALNWAEKYSWANVGKQFAALYERLTTEQEKSKIIVNTQDKKEEQKSEQALPTMRHFQHKPLKVLLQMRTDAFSNPGGDTVVFQRLYDGFKERGLNVAYDINGAINPKDFDLVHLFNFATSEFVDAFAQRCVQANVPFVVSTLYEDWALFFSRMIAYAYIGMAYVETGQDQSKWKELLIAAQKVSAPYYLNNEFAASHAELLFASGQAEKDSLNRAYKDIKKIEIVHFGSDIAVKEADPQKFVDFSGVSDFVLCVGRMECRKNQLMLLKALENVDVPVVLIAGSKVVQKEYEDACRTFRRRAPTLIFNRVEPEMLASAYAAAKVHALPSWYELPGLVTLEAAYYGTNVVASKNGTIYDYLGDEVFYCQPEDEESIKQAVTDAYAAEKNDKLRTLTSSFTWEKTVQKTIEMYSRL